MYVIQACACIHTNTSIYAHIHACMHAYMKYTCMHAYIHEDTLFLLTYTHRYIYTRTPCIVTYIHTYAHTYTKVLFLEDILYLHIHTHLHRHTYISKKHIQHTNLKNTYNIHI